MVPQIPDFPVLADPLSGDVTLPAFMVSETRGFLPRQDPLEKLPSEFDALEHVLQAMPIRTASGEPGLLALGKLGETVDGTFPNLVDAVEKYKNDQVVLAALYRDYCFLASAYLLEPCHHEFLKSGGYGLARDVLPANIAVPIAKVAELTGFKPFMEYAGSYALANYRLLNKDEGVRYDNLALIRAFEYGLDRTSSEAGFVLVHVDMVKDSGGLVKGVSGVLKGVETDDRAGANEGFRCAVVALRKINNTMEEMWKKSKPNDYVSFRTFIFGVTSQSMFPNGVLYDGVSTERMFFRGESGANDSIIPLCDNVLQITMPNTPLTKILEDFRQYRPGNHRDFLAYVKAKASSIGVQEWALKDGESAVLYLKIADLVREFRFRHWCFTREYILKKTSHPTATGGSPIVQWLPNQLNAVLELEQTVIQKLRDLNHFTKEVEEIADVVDRQKITLAKEVEKFCQERGVATATTTGTSSSSSH